MADADSSPVAITRVALCSVCDVHHPWTPERGWGCPRLVAPQDTVSGLAGRLRDAQTGLVMLAMKLETEARRALTALRAELARVTAERDALAARLDSARGLVATVAHHGSCTVERVRVDWCCYCDGACSCEDEIRATCTCEVRALRDVLGGVR